MLKKLWDAFCLTMGVSTKEGDGEAPDKWAAQREIARAEEERRRLEREEKWGQGEAEGGPGASEDEGLPPLPPNSP